MRPMLAILCAAGALALLPAVPAAACDPAYDPSCQTPCTVVRRDWDLLTRNLSDLPPRPVC